MRSASRARAARLLASGRNVYLAGFMGTGKTSTARALGRFLGVPWTDTDREIERDLGMSVAEIFARRGERAFRAAEHRVIRRVAAAGGSVVALGGGAVCFARNRDVLRGTGPVVVLSASPDVIWSRVSRAGTRPLLAGGDGYARTCALLAERARDYRRYLRRVDTDRLAPGAAAAAVLRVLEVPARRAAGRRAAPAARLRRASP